MNTPSERLIYLRKVKGITRDELAGLTGVDVARIVELESGGTWSQDEIQRVAEACGTTELWLTTGADSSLPAHYQTTTQQLVNLVTSDALTDRDRLVLLALAQIQAAQLTPEAAAAGSASSPQHSPQAGMTMGERARLLIKQIGAKRISEHGGLYSRWRSVSSGLVRVTTEEIDVLVSMLPQHALWLTTGMEHPPIGQLAPAIKDKLLNK